MQKFLDNTGLGLLWNKIEEKLAEKANASAVNAALDNKTETFVVNFETNADFTTVTTETSIADIVAAYDAGKHIQGILNYDWNANNINLKYSGEIMIIKETIDDEEVNMCGLKVDTLDGSYLLITGYAEVEDIWEIMIMDPLIKVGLTSDYSLSNKKLTNVAAPTANKDAANKKYVDDSIAAIVETDPTVPQWAKAQNKPTYTAAEVGAPTVQEMNTALADKMDNKFIVEFTIEMGNQNNVIVSTNTTIDEILEARSNGKLIQGTISPMYDFSFGLIEGTLVFTCNYDNMSISIIGFKNNNEDQWIARQTAFLSANLASTTNLDNTNLNFRAGGVKITGVGDPTSDKDAANKQYVDDAIAAFTETDPTVPSWAKAQTKPTYTASEVGAPTVAEMNTAIGTAIGNVHQFNLAIAQELPTQDIDTHTIYLIPKTGDTNDVYDEYVYINNAWEMIGNTQIDLSNYATISDMNKKAPAIYTIGASPITNAVPNMPFKSLILTIAGDPTDVGTSSASVTVGPSTTAAEGTTYTKSFDQIYEGTLDFVSGKLTITKAILDLGSIGYNYNDTHHYFYSQALYGIIDTNDPIYSSDMTVHTVEEIQSGEEGVAFGGATYIYVYNDNYIGMTIDEFKAAVAGKCIAYTLRTPRVVELGAAEICTLEGTTYVMSDDGTVSVEYQVDTKEYVDLKANKIDTVLDTTLSLGRKEGSTIGAHSVALGANDVIASGECAISLGESTEATGDYSLAEGGWTQATGNGAHAEGDSTIASGYASHAEGCVTQASNFFSHAEGCATEAKGDESHAEGYYTIATGEASHVGGMYNVIDDYSNWPEWTSETSYIKGDKVKRTIIENDKIIVKGYICHTANNDTTFNKSRWSDDGQINYVEIIGNGDGTNRRSNARALDWNGNEYLMGNLYVGCNVDSSGGSKLVSESNFNMGYGIFADPETHYIALASANDNQIKTGTNNYKPLVPSKQHVAIFYGLAKAAGDTTQSISTNAVGTYTNEAKTAIRTMLDVPATSDIPSVPVQDVQVNGTSVLSNGVANVPAASTNNFGVVRIRNNGGVALGSSDNNLIIDCAMSNEIKNGSASFAYKPITPAYQHQSVFYGLTKAAGVDMASSNNSVGTYTDSAKQAIQNMLGITDLLSTEESSTAIAAHAINSTFMMNGKLHRATAAIAIGDAVEVGTNCEVVKADEVFVKNTDYARENIPGIVGILSGYGIAINNSQPGHYLYLNPASLQEIKLGKASYKAIVPDRQDYSVFYGLSKVAGVDLANETVTLGTYPETSKTAIRSLIGAAAASDLNNKEDKTVVVTITRTLNQDNYVYSANKTFAQIVADIEAGKTVIATTEVYGWRTYYKLTDYGISTDFPEQSFIHFSREDGQDSTRIRINYNNTINYETTILSTFYGISINGTRIYPNDGISDIPLASNNTFGVVKTGALGVRINNDGVLYINSASIQSEVKPGVANYLPIVPSTQHASVFYGLSKVAGVDLANETVTLGTYPVAAASAIKTMLQVQEGLEVVRLV